MPFTMSLAQAEESVSVTEGMRKKRYRYRKRTHRVQVDVNFVPWSKIENEDGMPINLAGLYGYNLGWFEIGPNVKLDGQINNAKQMGLEAGLWAEFNFIKNTRKQKLVPALGLKANYKGLTDKELLLSPYLTLKYFTASRTGMVLNFNWNIVTRVQNFFNKIDMGANVSLGYVHYFN